MAMTPNGYGRFIGRVGALAVALGIGAAVANSPGIAMAQDGPSEGSAGTTESSDTSTTDGSTTPDSPASESTEDSEPSDIDTETDADNDDTEDDDSTGEDDDSTGEDSDDTGEEMDSADATADAEAPPSDDDESSNSGSGTDEESAADVDSDFSHPPSRVASQSVTTSLDADEATETSTHTVEATEVQSASGESTFAAVAAQSAQSLTLTSPTTTVTTGIGGLVSTVLSALGFGSQAASGPSAPPQAPMLWAMLGWARREIGHMFAPFAAAASTPVAALVAQDEVVAAAEDSPLATEEQLAAERLAAQTANSLPVALMKLVLRQGFLAAANELYPNGPDAENLALLDAAVNEYAMAAAFQQQLLDSMRPAFVTQVAPPHIWFGQNVPGSRILYDNPDTIYRFAGVNGASEYVIRGQFHNWSDVNARPADTSFSVLEGVAGTTSTILTVDENFVVNDDGTFEITVSREPTGGPNHLQLTSGSTIIAARNTLGDWNAEEPMSLSIERVGGPPNSLFAQIGGFAFLGPLVTSNPLLTTLVSLVPPLPMPPVVRGVFTAVILVVRGVNEQREYMALATNDPETGEAKEPNVLPQPSSNAEFLANQLQSNGNFELDDGEALVLTIDPGRANYFIVPTYNIWTITDDYWNEQTSLNNEQAIANDDGTYTFVISPTDPGVTNWVSTGGLNQGAISIRFQDLEPDPNNENAPRIVAQQVVSVDDADSFFENDPVYFVDEQERAAQLAARKDGFNKRWAPFPQP